MKPTSILTQTTTWLALLCFTCVSFFFADQSPQRTALSHPLLLGLAGAKFWGISYYFMELKEAHLFWKVLMALFLGFVVVGLYILR
ncbi:MAG: cytochrome C oxidase subunit IV family protein [Myxococcales bacterium]|nr:cytochrome C oxidase subunit IV family protein [Myxococcales bacterium]MCB9643091.1 cytochrome C oxidase subunit IV family protein [Myxococcales bacterium]